MDGFKIDYINADGLKEKTWFGKPMTSFNISNVSQKDIVGMVSMMFCNAHAGCKIIALTPCTQDDYMAMINN